MEKLQFLNKLSIPTPEYYLPLLYALARKDDKVIGGAASMTFIKIRNY